MKPVRVVAISDTHLRHLRHRIEVPEGDLLIHAGDAMIEGTPAEALVFFQWFSALPHASKVYVAGNHDTLFETSPELAAEIVPAGVTYLQDREATIAGLRIYGSPWTPEFMNWAFNLPRGAALARKWALIPEGLDLLITHGPPQGILDRVLGRGDALGCLDLTAAVARVKPRVHVFGHIHSGHGTVRLGPTTYVNAAMVDESYVPGYRAQVFEIQPRKGT